MKKVMKTVSLEGGEDIAKMILEIFKGKIGASNTVNLIKGKTNKMSPIYDKDFEKEFLKFKDELFSDLARE